jgi:hypothetical protein
MKKFIIISLFGVNLFAAMISGNQGKVSITGGNMDVTSGGSTVTVSSGEITSYGENSAPSKARKIEQGDLNDINKDLSPSSDEVDTINIKLEPISPDVAKQLRLELIRKGIDREKINLSNVTTGTQIFIEAIPLSKIRTIWNGHFKAGTEFFKKESNDGKVPTITIKEGDLKKYHRTLFSKSN